MPKSKPDTQAPAPAAPAAALRKVSLAGFAVQTPAAKTAKAYPLLPDPEGQVAEMTALILDQTAQLEALEGSVELLKGELIALAKPFYFQHHAGQHAVASSIEARAADGRVVRVGFSSSYRSVSDEAALLRLAGDHAARLYHSLKQMNRELGAEFFEGLVMKRLDSPYPLQLRSSTEESRAWIKHRFLA